jgi:hypothetical protein
MPSFQRTILKFDEESEFPGISSSLTGTANTTNIRGSTAWLGYLGILSLGNISSCFAPQTLLPFLADPPFPPVWPFNWNTSILYGRDNVGQNLRIVRGNTLKFTIRITQNGNPVSLTGGTLKLTAKWHPKDSQAASVFTCTSSPPDGIVFTNPSQGEAQITISATKTASLPPYRVPLNYDVEFVNSAGEVYTVLLGKILVIPDITTS